MIENSMKKSLNIEVACSYLIIVIIIIVVVVVKMHRIQTILLQIVINFLQEFT